MINHDSYLNSFSTGNISASEIEQGIQRGRRLRARAARNLFDKVRRQFVAPF